MHVSGAPFRVGLVLCDIHGNELCKIDLITGAPFGINPSLLNLCVSIHGKDLRTFQFRQGEVVFCKSLVLHGIHGNELHQIDLITGAFHGVNPSSLNILLCAYTSVGRIHVLLFKQDFTLISEKYVNHSRV